jgi:hypothetical protein
METRTRRMFGAISLAGALMVGGVAISGQTTVGDGLITVAVGDVNILNNADIGVAAQVAAQICGVKVGPVAVLGRAVDRGLGDRVVCQSNQGPVTLTQ